MRKCSSMDSFPPRLVKAVSRMEMPMSVAETGPTRRKYGLKLPAGRRGVSRVIGDSEDMGAQRGARPRAGRDYPAPWPAGPPARPSSDLELLQEFIRFPSISMDSERRGDV